MPLNMNQPLSWKKALEARDDDSAAELAMLHDLQGNILKSHGREHTANLFLAFDPNQAEAAQKFVASVGYEVTSALRQFSTTELYKAKKIDAGPFVTLLLTARGYQALGKQSAMPEGAAFREGMAQRPLEDPPRDQWDEHFRGEVHALLIVAADDEPRQEQLRYRYEAMITSTGGAVRVVGVEIGYPQLNKDENHLEHFGYVDGRSQPLALVEDIEREEKEYDGIDKWDPSIPLGQLLTSCPGGRLEVSMGSYFVFRKLEQDVKGFKTREEALGLELGDIGERAGASVVGRFENGTPVTKSDVEIKVTKEGDAGIFNNFDYSADTQGLKCPFAGHIRKTNPRSDLPGSKATLMARRGITYGKREDDLNDGRLDNKPSYGVGLLFMSYQSDLESQFEVTQRFWANNPDFVHDDTGIDPIIGNPQSVNPPPAPPDIAAQRYPTIWDSTLSEPIHFSGYVKMLGGEYFFAPSISFLRTMEPMTP